MHAVLPFLPNRITSALSESFRRVAEAFQVAENTVSRKRRKEWHGGRGGEGRGGADAQGSRKREEFHWGEGTSGGGEEFSPAARFSHVTIRQRNKYSLPPPAISRAR